MIYHFQQAFEWFHKHALSTKHSITHQENVLYEEEKNILVAEQVSINSCRKSCRPAVRRRKKMYGFWREITQQKREEIRKMSKVYGT
jgi:hypothetical protein